MPNSRSPLKNRPLRNPGQSLDEQIHDLISDYACRRVFALFLVLLAALEWIEYVEAIPPKPVLYSVPAVVALGYAVFRFFPVRREVRALRLGRDGEKDVGQKLEVLRKTYEILHDIIGNGFNLDHVLIGPAGIFTVETKTHSKPVKGNPSILFDGDKIIVARLEPERNPVVQAKAQASWLRELLAESTGRKFEVRPVIVYPGWFVENRSADRNRIWVLNPKGLSTFLDHEPMRLKPEDIRMASYHLDRFVRA
jgi:hypothetical protein